MTILITNSSGIKSDKAKAMETFFVKRAGWPAGSDISMCALGL